MLRKILIANRGEIALRILQACHEMGKQCVAPYTKVDSELRHLDLADSKICIGERSYMQIDDLISAAKLTGCDGIHPGYGLLSENADFAEKVEENNLKFIGPKPDQLRLLENKAKVRQVMADLGLQIIPGAESNVDDIETAKTLAKEITYPIVIKASFGGGGRGIRIIHREGELKDAYQEAAQEAAVIFGNSDLYMEKYFNNARHIEIQVLGDGKGKVIHLGSRDCSVQRRNQKLVEEAPAPNIDTIKLDELAMKSVSALSKLNYRSAATLEFLYQDDEFYFMEINPRLQVEHPVTEQVTGFDIVKAQLLIADTDELPWEQSQISLKGSAIECRINAEDACFKPSPGEITKIKTPSGNGIRLDSHIYAGYNVPHHYDSLLAKLIVLGSTRQEAVAKMQRALGEFDIQGIDTSISVLQEIVKDPDFVAGQYTTQILSDEN